jgi:outer membrane protein OmpA-like peptidoglycan-associated protein
MKNLILSFLCLIFLFLHNLEAQTFDKPWSFSTNSNIINLLGNNLEERINFGGPALGLSRYLSSGLSIGSQISIGKVDNFTDSYNYSSVDGFLKFNLSEGNIVPYFIGGYGFSVFSDGIDRKGLFPSSETSRTIFGGIGFGYYLTDNVSINLQSTYRSMNENDGFNHLQSFVGIVYNFGSGDSDKDGVSDKKDKCPDVPGLKGFEGCPDTDGDGIPDKEDKCPEIQGTLEFNGCIDSDSDGISDPDDNCPEESGTTEMNGCPDIDGDGISDDIDECKGAKGPKENNGCPWPDNDGDGVPDKDDLCKDEAGIVSNNGCPQLSSEIVATLNKFGSKIYFPANSSQIIGKKTMEVLEDIKNILSENPKGKIIIEGYASSDGDEEFNIDLSVRRAKSVLNYLIGLGISVNRLEVEGYGELEPLGDNSNSQGRAMNRRVQFKPKKN